MLTPIDQLETHYSYEIGEKMKLERSSGIAETARTSISVLLTMFKSIRYTSCQINNQLHRSKYEVITNQYHQNTYHEDEILIHAETENFIIRICGTEFPTSMAIKKRDRSNATRSFQSFQLREGLNPRRFTAIGSNSESYILDLDRHCFIGIRSDQAIAIESARWIQNWSYRSS